MTAPDLDLAQPYRQPRWLRLLLRLAVPALILGLLWNLADGPGALALLGNPDWRYLALAFAAVNLQTLLSAWRWQRVAKRLELAITPSRAVAEYYLSQVVNQSLPGGIVGDAARAVRMRHASGLGTAAKAVIIERMAGQVFMFGLLFAGIAWAVAVPGGIEFSIDPAHALVGVAVLAIAAVGLAALARSPIRRWSGAFWRAAYTALVAKGAWREQSLLGVSIVACNLGGFAFCALATGTALSPEAIVVLIPLILCAMLIPATVAGWGFREGAAVALFPLAGATAAAGFAASLAFGLVILAASLPGLLVLLPSRHRLRARQTHPPASEG